jgi:hypothetical protein
MYFERLNRDGSRGIIIIKHIAPGAVTIRPKGLNRAQKYLVSFQESNRSELRTGASLMQEGILLNKMVPGELIYFNVPYHPGSPLFRTPPTAPGNLKTNIANDLGYPGVQLKWEPARDEHWISFYEVLRNGKLLDKVAKGTYYFDHSVGADLAARYSVIAVNGGGLRSRETRTVNHECSPGDIVDDADSERMRYAGNWQHESGLQPAYEGTLSSSDEKGASLSCSVFGSTITWFTRLCAECGQAEFIVDGHLEATVDTYSADDIFGVGIYSKRFPQAGLHQIAVRVVGKHGGPRGKGTRVYVDGIAALDGGVHIDHVTPHKRRDTTE